MKINKFKLKNAQLIAGIFYMASQLRSYNVRRVCAGEAGHFDLYPYFLGFCVCEHGYFMLL